MAINKNSSNSPDAVLPLISGTSIGIQAWTMVPPSNTENFTVSLNVPHDYNNASGSTIVIVHFVTDNYSASGNVNMQLSTLFTAPGGASVTSPLTNYTQTVSGVKPSTTGTTYNHYEAVFTLSGNISADDFALLNLTLTGSGCYSSAIYLTSVEFRYTCN
jgi:hypothetical protein